MLNCFSCGKEIKLIENKAGFREECPACHADVHVCRNCEFYDEKSYNECREPTADRITVKDRANYCDHFSPSSKVRDNKSQKEALQAAAEALFKKS